MFNSKAATPKRTVNTNDAFAALPEEEQVDDNSNKVEDSKTIIQSVVNAIYSQNTKSKEKDNDHQGVAAH